jgi:HPr kinase/phosphorylase
VRCHGALVEIGVEAGGIGVLLLGPSGVGKSECALELVRRGHRLVADDVVDVERNAAGEAIGRALPRLGHHMEIRGLGILCVPDLFGPESVRESVRVDLICRLDPPAQGREYERVGIERPTERLADVEIPRVTLPARPGSNIATVVEAAARDEALRRTGVNAAARLDGRLLREMGGA